MFKAVFKAVGAVLRLFAGVIKRVIWVFGVIKKNGALAGVSALLQILLGFIMRVFIVMFGPLIRTVLTLLLLYIGPVLMTLFHTLIFVVAVLLKLVIGIMDCVLGGRLRFLSYAHESPDAWWQRAGYERGNRYSRFAVSWMPCGKGYMPSGMVCACEPTDMPHCSPAALLVRRYVWGSFREWGRTLPARNAEALKRFRSMCAREYASAFQDQRPGRYARDLVECLIVARDVVFDGVKGVDELATYASWVTGASGGRVVLGSNDHLPTPTIATSSTMPWWPLLMLACSVAVASVIIGKAHGSSNVGRARLSGPGISRSMIRPN